MIRIGTTTRFANFYEELALYKRVKLSRQIHAITDRLPPREQPSHFVGRQNELAQLWRWVKEPKSRRAALAGDGRKGKTAIAYEFASRIAEASPEPYEIVLWASAKRRQFVLGEPVPISEPDFKDLPSLLDKLLNDIGFSEDLALPHEQKREKVLELLNMFPALLVIDDLDSIDWSLDVDTMEFITFEVPHSKSKILMTTRRQIPSIQTIFVTGFTESEGYQFIDSRLQLAGISTDIVSKVQRNKILQITDSSPLYIEDLLRLFVMTGDLDETIRQWSSRSGDEARSYALKRELEMLSDDAKLALLAFSVLDQPATGTEAKAVAGLTWTKWSDAVGELQRLFLISRPGIVEGLPRFALNSNTKSLVLSVMENNPNLTRIREAVRSITGESYRDTERRKSVGACINQANTFIRIGDCQTAEKTIEAGLQKREQDPDLLGALGLVYKSWSPQRLEDARERFRRSGELKCKTAQMYGHCYEMEEQNEYWNGAIEAPEAALLVFPRNQLWSYRLGYALSTNGQVLARQLQPRGRVYLARAQKTLSSLAEKLHKTVPLDTDLHMKTSRALVFNGAALYGTVTRAEKGKYLSQLAVTTKAWITQYGSDTSVDYDSQNLLSRYPELKERMQ